MLSPLRAAALVAALAAAVIPALAAEPALRVAPEALGAAGGMPLRDGWRFRPGDDPLWAGSSLDDSGWERLDGSFLRRDSLRQSGLSGVGWFRLRVDVDPALAGTPLALRLNQLGASEVFVDGALVASYGRVAATAAEEITWNPRMEPVPVVFASGGEHVVAVRYSCATCTTGPSAWLARWYSLGFSASLEAAPQAVSGFASSTRVGSSISWAFVGLLVAFGTVHLLLFAFDRRERANLYYALFVYAFAANSAMLHALSTAPMRVGAMLALVTLSRISVAVIFVSFLAFLYAAFDFATNWIFRAIAAMWVVATVVTPLAFSPTVTAWAIGISIGVSVHTGIHIIVKALRHRIVDAWIIGVGVVIYAVALAVQLAARFFPTWSGELGVAAVVIFVGLPAFVSVYLARRFARTKSQLAAKLVEVEELSARTLEHERREADQALHREQQRAQIALLEAENERRARELEEARQLQLSMLPSTVPDLPGLEIAAYMKPATEVGGDYYDFHVGSDGTLTVVVGDATGHGLKAGTLVTATKGLFNAFADDADITGFLRQSSRALKRLNLRHLYMALTVVKIKNGRARVSAAGMPPILVFRAAAGEVEEITIPGMPLGGVAFPYRELELGLEPGDAVLIMSDGFPERFNDAGEMLDYTRAREVLREAAGRRAEAIIEHFVSTGDEWARGRPQDDDVTFVVVKASVDERPQEGDQG